MVLGLKNIFFARYFHYRVSGAKGEELIMRMTNAGDASYPSAYEGYWAYASYNRKYWFKVPTTYDKASGVLTIRHTPKKVTILLWSRRFG
jgi:Cytosolic carboxypeptidase N-terminal domain